MLKQAIRLSVIFSFCSIALAAPQKRQSIQNKRIEKGVSSGSINNAEAKRLELGQKKVQRKSDRLEQTKQNAKQDGVVTKVEKRKIKRQKINLRNTQDRQSKKINRKKTN